MIQKKYRSTFNTISQNLENEIYSALPFGGKEYVNSAQGYDLYNVCPGFDTKASVGKAPVMKLWGM